MIPLNHRGETLEQCAQRLERERNGTSHQYATQVALVLELQDHPEQAVFYRVVAHLLTAKHSS